jgi:peptidoglycan hydrolase CwlO-like protein
MSNRVEELESQVAKLQAAVDGLTEELVETRERLRQLEADEGVEHTRAPERREVDDDSTAAADVDAGADAGADAPRDAETAAEPGAVAADADATESAPETDDDDGSDSDGNDIIVA